MVCIDVACMHMHILYAFFIFAVVMFDVRSERMFFFFTSLHSNSGFVPLFIPQLTLYSICTLCEFEQ